MSWESTVEYYRLANEETRARLGGLHSAPLLLWSVDFAEIEELQAAGSWDEAGALLAGAARTLEQAGAELLVLCTNTMHKVADAIEASVDIPLVHIVDCVAVAVSAAGMRRVGLLGTRFTMEEPFWAERMGRHGIEVVVPGPEDRESRPPGHLRGAVPRRLQRPLTRQVRRDHGEVGWSGRRGGRPRLHGDRAPRSSGRHLGARLPLDRDPRSKRSRRCVARVTRSARRPSRRSP